MMLAFFSMGQSPQALNYQAVARNAGGAALINSTVTVRIGIISGTATGVLEWEETHAVTTNSYGWFNLTIGQGTSTGNGAKASFALINWGISNHYCKVDVDPGTGFITLGEMQFLSVPYALYSSQAGNLSSPLSVNDLNDADTSGVVSGDVLKWNGTNWAPAKDIVLDSLTFALEGQHSINSDTALYAFQSLISSDSVIYSNYSDSASYADSAGYSLNSEHSIHSDTALYSLNCVSTTGNWTLQGNLGTNPAINFIGSTDATDLVMKTNNTERLRIKSDGKVGIGTASPVGSLHIVGNDGLIEEGTFGSGAAIGVSGAGTRMFWYPKKAAFRAGAVTGANWDDANIGNYSFATGYDTKASGQYSFAGGQTSLATADYAMAFGFNAIASGVGAVAIGSQATASGYSSIALGRGSVANDSGGVALTYHGSAGRYALAFGYYTSANGRYSVAMGTSASTNNHKGSFVFADLSKQSTLPTTLSSADNQFLAKASGGFIFYTDANTTMGVSLPAGGGSWASVSDKNKKGNFRKVNTGEILDKLAGLEITTWNYKTQDPSIRHMGPMAQDFYAAFGLGENETSISTIDIDGISLAAIQELEKKTQELKQKSEEIEKLRRMLKDLKAEKDLLEKRITRAEGLIESK